MKGIPLESLPDLYRQIMEIEKRHPGCMHSLTEHINDDIRKEVLEQAEKDNRHE